MNADRVQTLFLLTGPTAVGKTELSIDWALSLGAEILSCDSLLFYKGMDIGTAKPSMQELERVTHHGIDIVELGEQYNVGRYIDYAKTIIETLGSRNQSVVVTGGSGFYLKGFVAPVFDSVDIPEDVNDRVETLYAQDGIKGVVELLKEVSPDDWMSVDTANARRVVPALKRCLATGLSLGGLKQRMEAIDPPFGNIPKKSVLLMRSIETLSERIRLRTGMMIENGLVTEVEDLLSRGFLDNPSACNSIGYREVLQLLQGNLDIGDLKEAICINTLKLVKKQLKWFRNQMTFDQTIYLDEMRFEGSEVLPMTLVR
jgi:tRNA dimethylallyltransferase